MLGTLYGIGVGPGDPDLLTLKAVKILGRVGHVYAASSSSNDYSLALEIVRDHLRDGVPVHFLDFPMTFDKNHQEEAWRANCDTVAEQLENGVDVAFLTLGDPMTFSTFIYLWRTIKYRLPSVPVEIVPGITSYQAAAACAGVALAEAEETLTIISGAKGGRRLSDILPFSDNVVLMKAYKQFPQILDQIRRFGLEDSVCFVSRCGLKGQVVEKDFRALEDLKPHYLSLLIVKKGAR
ncbi:precorrin-2 C(20)-methyltransferase [Desulfosoma caldarium]|uniref:Precorrin-2 C20-methyltransferase /cobalt-factor II C20-methyltransferase n=1 Tax=Desulfosoma caldarium TaxID=610254 RepID=A0A3N1VMJ9_9BACT|nr:precorrin-2 C(20)-methyltransferase [Desulfosoma caldarium]ROR03180.1 precorrin-2 C20-methyltransferase /cobalt-factor II C20-methyltransferase [Desulfosoma caldarium]